jgi:hypothetical protein
MQQHEEKARRLQPEQRAAGREKALRQGAFVLKGNRARRTINATARSKSAKALA